MNETNVLSVENISVVFGDLMALTNVSFRCDKGAVTGLVGPNGSGKSTTLRLVSGLLRPDHGAIKVKGLDPRDHLTRRHLALVPDKASGFDELSVDEYLDVVFAAHRRLEARPVARELLAAFHLEGRRRHRMDTLSMGMRRQVTIAAAAALKPELLLVDEATATLDPEAVVVLRTIVNQLARNSSAVLVATQDLAFAEKVCDRIVMLVSGRMQIDGPIDAILDEYNAPDLESVLLQVAERSAMIAEVEHALAAR